MKCKNKHLTFTFLQNENDGKNYDTMLKELKECMRVFMKLTNRLEYLLEAKSCGGGEEKNDYKVDFENITLLYGFFIDKATEKKLGE